MRRVSAASLPLRLGGGPLRACTQPQGGILQVRLPFILKLFGETVQGSFPDPIGNGRSSALAPLLWPENTCYTSPGTTRLTQHHWVPYADSRSSLILPHTLVMQRSLLCLSQFLPCPNSGLARPVLGFSSSWSGEYGLEESFHGGGFRNGYGEKWGGSRNA